MRALTKLPSLNRGLLGNTNYAGFAKFQKFNFEDALNFQSLLTE